MLSVVNDFSDGERWPLVLAFKRQYRSFCFLYINCYPLRKTVRKDGGRAIDNRSHPALDNLKT